MQTNRDDSTVNSTNDIDIRPNAAALATAAAYSSTIHPVTTKVLVNVTRQKFKRVTF